MDVKDDSRVKANTETKIESNSIGQAEQWVNEVIETCQYCNDMQILDNEISVECDSCR